MHRIILNKCNLKFRKKNWKLLLLLRLFKTLHLEELFPTKETYLFKKVMYSRSLDSLYLNLRRPTNAKYLSTIRNSLKSIPLFSSKLSKLKKGLNRRRSLFPS